MNENKHGDTYKVEMLRRMLTHETDAKEVHYGAKLSHSGRGIKPLTIDAGGIDALIVRIGDSLPQARASVPSR